MKRVIFLDIDDTLLDFSLCAKESMRVGFAELGLPFSEETFATFTRINDVLWQRIERGELTTQELFRFRWNRIFSALGIKADGEQFEQRFLDLLYQTAIPVTGAREVCAYLQEKYILCAASNAFHDQQLNRLSMAGLLPFFTHVFVSETLGHRKPEKAFFDACLLSLPGIAPEECVMVGDSLSADVAGGVNAGMETIWYNHNRRTVPENCPADHNIDSLTELKDLL